MKKSLFVFLLFFVLGLGSVRSAYAVETEDMKYMEYIDDTYLYNLPSFYLNMYQELLYPNKFLFIKFGQPEVLRNNIFNVGFGTELTIKNLDIYDVGFNSGEMALRYDVEFYVIDVTGEPQLVPVSFDVPLLDVFDSKQGRIRSNFEYEDFIALCPYSADLYTVVIKNVSVTLYSTVLNRCGTTYIYEIFYEDNKYDECLISHIEQYIYNSDAGRVFVSNDTGKQENVDTGVYTIKSVHPDDFVYHKINAVGDAVADFITKVPTVAYNLLTFCVGLLELLPDFILTVIPVLPAYLVYAFVYVLYFGIIAGLWKLFRG